MKNMKVKLPEEKIEEFCRRWQITELAVFGSVLRDDFRPDSDIDFLVSFAPDENWSLFDLVDMERELAAIVGRKVDLIEKVAIERSHNQLRRKEILSTAQTFYVTR
ncbi:MAG: nucleotidyltransferase family protein [Hormoscilla sp. SP5CHS1]|nr:nucleotidyltransferase family protein [Hormoscilla sp. SP12CHS1]MBC6452580.1 nucleotidyltransferase family protein [Hormoscilla sp. SP5CHS1]